MKGSVSQSITGRSRPSPCSCQSSCCVLVRVAVLVPSPTWPGTALVDHDHAVEEERLAAEGGGDVRRGEDVGRRAEGDEPAVEQGDQLEALRRRLHVVGRDEDGDALARAGRASSSSTASLARASTPVKGSSSSRTCGSWARARARKARCCCPPESSPMGRAARSAMPSCPSARSDGLAVGRLRPLERPEPAVPAHHDDVAHRHREAPVDLLALRHVGDGVGPGRPAAGRGSARGPRAGAAGRRSP